MGNSESKKRQKHNNTTFISWNIKWTKRHKKNYKKEEEK